MRGNEKAIVKRVMCLSMITLVLSGCTTVETARVIKPGDRVGVHFTCRLPNGEIASSTEKSIADNSGLPKSAIFMASHTNDSVKLPTGAELEELRHKQVLGMEEEIISQLTDAVVGMNYDESRTLKLTAAMAPTRDGDTHILHMARMRRRPKQLHLSVAEYKSRKHVDPVVGQDYTLDPEFPGKVVDVTESEVVVRFSAKVGDIVNTPFGKGVIRELDERYEYEIDARKGSLVRSGPLVGRISNVDDRLITIDYANPFAGEELTCDVRTEMAAGESITAVKTGEKSSADPASPRLTKAEGDAQVTKVDKVITDAVNKSDVSAHVDPTKNPAVAQNGDLVTVNFTAAFEDGAVIGTTLESVALDAKRKKVSWFMPLERYAPEEIKAGSRELMPGLGDAVLGMTEGAKKRVTLAPKQAYGLPDPSRIVKYPVVKTIPRLITMPAEDYVKRFNSFPVVGKEVELTPYFKARVVKVSEKTADLECLAKDGKLVDEDFGSTLIQVKGDVVSITLTPRIDGVIETGGETGRVIAADNDTVTVDFNNPLAGKKIVLDLEVVSLTKASSLQTKPIEWTEDHDAGLALAKEEVKPLFLLLYADWCGWCKKTQTETLTDPRIGRLRDHFVWMKLNSDKETKYKQMYGQGGFPMMVLLKSDGTVAEKIDGFRDGAALGRVLKDFLAKAQPGQTGTKTVSATDGHK